MKWMKNIRRHCRFYVQLIFTALTNGYLLGFTKGKIYQGKSKQICVPGLNCYSCPGAIGSCPIGSLQAVIGSRNYQISFYVIGFLMIVGVLMGRFVCGWLCPFGLVQDLLYKIPIFHKKRYLPFERYLRWLKYVILVVFVIGMPMLIMGIGGYGTPWFCKLICPSGTLFAGIPLVTMNSNLQQALGGLFVWKASLLIFCVVLSIKLYRPFCRYICPLGAVYGLFQRFSLYHYEIDEEKCTKCGLCQKSCDLNIVVYREPNSIECIRCGKCIKICPAGAIYTTCGAHKKNEKFVDQ